MGNSMWITSDGVKAASADFWEVFCKDAADYCPKNRTPASNSIAFGYPGPAD